MNAQTFDNLIYDRLEYAFSRLTWHMRQSFSLYRTSKKVCCVVVGGSSSRTSIGFTVLIMCGSVETEQYSLMRHVHSHVNMEDSLLSKKNPKFTIDCFPMAHKIKFMVFASSGNIPVSSEVARKLRPWIFMKTCRFIQHPTAHIAINGLYEVFSVCPPPAIGRAYKKDVNRILHTTKYR